MSGVVTTRAALEAMGFEGFVRFEELPAKGVPTGGGVYAILRVEHDPPVFLAQSPAGAIRGDPSVAPEKLTEAWVDGAEVVYFGKASEGPRRGLRRRLDEYRRHGLGGRARHWGGRYIWQLADADRLLVAWKPTPNEHPERVEARLLHEFLRATGRRPFANRNLGQRSTVRRPAADSAPPA